MSQERYNEIKNRLGQVWCAKREMQKYTDLIESAISNVTKITPSYSLAPGGSNSNSNKMADYAADIEELYTRRDEAIKNYLAAIKDVDDLINMLDNKLYIAILRRRYIGGERWESIADELCYTVRRVTQLHFEAITKLSEMI